MEKKQVWTEIKQAKGLAEQEKGEIITIYRYDENPKSAEKLLKQDNLVSPMEYKSMAFITKIK